MAKAGTAILSVVIVALTFAGCGLGSAPRMKGLLSHGVWQHTKKEKVMEGIVKALHSEGYMVLGISEKSGLISTDWSGFIFKQEPIRSPIDAKFRLNILVFPDSKFSITASVKTSARWSVRRKQKNWGERHDEWCRALVNNKISEKLQDLFLSFERTIGKASTTGHKSISWQ